MKKKIFLLRRLSGGTLPCMTFTETAFEGHNQHSKSLNKQYRELTKYSHFSIHVFKQDLLKIILITGPDFYPQVGILGPGSIRPGPGS